MRHVYRLFLVTLALATMLAGPSCRADGQTRIYFVRHADTAKGANGRYIEQFSPTGVAQVAALTAKLDALGVRFDAVVCSPAWRAMNTIRPYLQAKGLVAELWPELTETSWEADGMAGVVRSEGEIVIAADDAVLFKARDASFGALSPSFSHTTRLNAAGASEARSLVQFASDLLKGRWNGQAKNILVVGHYHTGSRLLERLQGASAASYDPRNPRYPTSNTGIHVLFQDCSGGDYLLERYNDRTSYNGAVLPVGSPDYPGARACR